MGSTNPQSEIRIPQSTATAGGSDADISEYWDRAPRHGASVTSQHLRLHQSILSDLDYHLKPGATVLDFGCGAGEMVSEYRKAGYQAFGCDIRLETDDNFRRLIEEHPYRLPFADHSFDFVFSDQVLEHVQDHEQAFSEISRVMRPGALSLHIFPAKLAPVEGHVFVPLAGAIQSRAWLTFWAWLQLREESQRGKGFREVADENYAYLKNRTRYLSKSEIVEAASPYFDEISFVERYMIKHSYGRARYIYPIVKALPFTASLYSTFYSRVILLRKNI